jgi:hypothetical protein
MAETIQCISIKFGILGYMLEVVIKVGIYLFILISFTGLDCIKVREALKIHTVEEGDFAACLRKFPAWFILRP